MSLSGNLQDLLESRLRKFNAYLGGTVEERPDPGQEENDENKGED